MRVTQSMITRNYLKGLNRTLSDRASSNERITSGRRFTKISENVSDGARALKIREQMYKNEQQLVNIRDAQGELSGAESNLKSINEILQTVQEKSLAGISGTASGDKRKILAQEIDNLKDQVLQFANARFADKFLFSGTNNAAAPFTVDASGKLLYNSKPVDEIYKNPVDGKFYIDDPTATPIPQNDPIYIDVGLGMKFSGSTVDPKSAFEVSFSGLNVLGFGVDADSGLPNNLYSILDNISKTLNPTPPAEFDKDAADALHKQLVKQTDVLMENITDVGTRVNFLDKTTERLENDLDNLDKLRAKLEAVDDATETINMKMYEFAWMATLQIGSKLIPQSLMDFIR